MHIKAIINLIFYAMKRLLLFIALTITANSVFSQKSIDRLFDKYAGKDGFVTVTLNGNLLKLLSCHDDDQNDTSLPADITEIRILAQEDDNMNVENFYSQTIDGINLDNYEEFMRVKESGQEMRMLVRTEGRNFKEFLLIAGGEDNVLIQIKGNMTFGEAKKFSEDAKKNHGLNIVTDQK